MFDILLQIRYLFYMSEISGHIVKDDKLHDSSCTGIERKETRRQMLRISIIKTLIVDKMPQIVYVLSELVHKVLYIFAFIVDQQTSKENVWTLENLGLKIK
ncbi:hypothetical protein AMECASPLE_035217 [Ameca splendens]|uniref:Uncharacterized protein n=1 Tax=Ameca splendens TaxID=208324 RepID=A0ABV1ADN5_9TELE